MDYWAQMFNPDMFNMGGMGLPESIAPMGGMGTPPGYPPPVPMTPEQFGNTYNETGLPMLPGSAPLQPRANLPLPTYQQLGMGAQEPLPSGGRLAYAGGPLPTEGGTILPPGIPQPPGSMNSGIPPIPPPIVPPRPPAINPVVGAPPPPPVVNAPPPPGSPQPPPPVANTPPPRPAPPTTLGGALEGGGGQPLDLTPQALRTGQGGGANAKETEARNEKLARALAALQAPKQPDNVMKPGQASAVFQPNLRGPQGGQGLALQQAALQRLAQGGAIRPTLGAVLSGRYMNA